MQSSISRIQTTQMAALVHTAVRALEPVGDRQQSTPSAFFDALKRLYLSSFERRNALLDGLFYDVSTITKSEAAELSPALAEEGAIVYVPTTASSEPLKVIKTLTELATQTPKPKALAIAGVGSSALGSAALARNVADALDAPAVAVVSGYGAADLMTEALGGYFLFGTLNRIRHAFDTIEAMTSQWSSLFNASSGQKSLGFGLRKFSDVAATAALLRDENFEFSVLCGHSKGNLILAEALEKIVSLPDKKHMKRIAARSQVITLSAAIQMPSEFAPIIDVLGTADPLGRANSRPFISIEKKLPGVGHHTNTEFPDIVPKPLNVTEVIRNILKEKQAR
ncbi:MAG: hypothetical protein AAF607_11185 [Pseudomonadota bacterium]